MLIDRKRAQVVEASKHEQKRLAISWELFTIGSGADKNLKLRLRAVLPVQC